MAPTRRRSGGGECLGISSNTWRAVVAGVLLVAGGGRLREEGLHGGRGWLPDVGGRRGGRRGPWKRPGVAAWRGRGAEEALGGCMEEELDRGRRHGYMEELGRGAGMAAWRGSSAGAEAMHGPCMDVEEARGGLHGARRVPGGGPHEEEAEPWAAEGGGGRGRPREVAARGDAAEAGRRCGGWPGVARTRRRRRPDVCGPHGGGLMRRRRRPDVCGPHGGHGVALGTDGERETREERWRRGRERVRGKRREEEEKKKRRRRGREEEEKKKRREEEEKKKRGEKVRVWEERTRERERKESGRRRE